MSVNTVYALHGIQNSSTFLSQINNARPTTGSSIMSAQSSGLPFPLFVATQNANPGIPFETEQVKTVLDLTGALSSIVDLSGANTDLYFKKVADLGRRVADATTQHIRYRMSQAWLGLDSITAGDRSPAVASCRLGTTYDGSNNPLVPAGSVAVSGTPTNAEHFVAGPVSLNTVALPGVQEITLEFNRQYIELGADGELYNTFAALGSYAPVVTIRCLEQSWATYGLNGTSLTAMSVWLRKISRTGRVANATEEHILFTATAGLITVEESSGGTNEPSITTIRCTLVGADASTEPIAVDTTAAIS